MRSSLSGARKHGLILTMLLIAGLGLPARAMPATEGVEIGAVAAIALDANGDGWAWAQPAPQTFATSFLVRIDQGTWRVAADSTTSADLLPPGLHLTRMAITADAADGWAVGGVSDGETSRPVLWRLQNGAWRNARRGLAATSTIRDLALSADGADGWMIVQDQGTGLANRLLRLRNGAWNDVEGPGGVILSRVGLSPDGHSGWMAGVLEIGKTGLFRLDGGRWVLAATDGYSPADVPRQIAVDNSGTGWLLNGVILDGPAGDGILEGGYLIRLSPTAAPRRQSLPLPAPRQNSPAPFLPEAVAVDGRGRGWLVALFALGVHEDLPISEQLYQPLLFRLTGDTATLVPVEQAGLQPAANLAPAALALGADGGHTWLGRRDGVGFGGLDELREPWPYPAPPAAPPLPGAAHCFAEVPYCLRGIFARYWEQHGGLEQLGFPITPEIQERLGGKSYTVQYTQRVRLEQHPENAGTPAEVLLGLLGNTLVEPRLNEAPFRPVAESSVPGVRWFRPTGHTIGPPFLAYWAAHGGLPVYGLPRSEAFDERNAADGRTYRVQYFERNRLEYHPENAGTRFEMLLGLLGVEQFTRTFAYTP